ncbi:MAG TPA: GNAT family N-acetyltransferase [Longimicrobium sp.]|jgi:N-acetylglutamate synthase-like GNAT family acetyltransferase|uniref:GNAT family N-acetyltransferase n=1 Tax=Longimicrobium sp. TaxID=2029185 RepID=UPI002ED9C17C
MVQIRPYRSSDAQAVSEVIRTTMRVSNAADYPMEQLEPLIDYFSPEKVEQINRDRTCLVAEEDGQVIGTAALENDELVTFFIVPKYQGRRVGTALLERLESIAREQGVAQLKVGSSLTGAAFYERHGYQRTAGVVEGTAGPQILMRKLIQ